MYKRKLYLFIVFIFTFFSSFLIKVDNVNACPCNNWRYDSIQSTTYPYGVTTTGVCLDNSCSQVTVANPGFYPCNAPGGVCPIGSSPANGNPSNNTGGVACTETAPANINVTKISDTSATITWTPGANGSYQSLWVSTNSNPQTGCAGSLGGTATCPVRLDSGNTPIASDVSSYTIDNLLTPGTVYYVRVMNYQSTTCYVSTDKAYLSSCNPSPATYTMTVGDVQTLTWNLPSSVSSIIKNLTFVTNQTYLTVNPIVDTTNPYQTNFTAVASTNGSPTNLGTYFYKDAGGGWSELLCTANTAVTITRPEPWWQVVDGDVTTNGSLSSNVPDLSYFGTPGLGGFTGLPVYGGTFNLSSTPTKISASRWYANTLTSTERLFDYSYFKNLIPGDTVINDISNLAIGGTISNGYEWYKVTGNVDINSNIDFGTRKVILFVESGNLNINANLNLTDNSGFFGTFVNGNINIDPTVIGTPSIEGIYLTDGTFSTGSGSSPLYIRGSVVAHGAMSLQRDLSDNTLPAEIFEFAPDQILLFPDKLGYRAQRWSEIAP